MSHNNNVLKLLNNRNYASMIYLMLNKNFTYAQELTNNLERKNWGQYFDNLIKQNLCKKYTLTSDEDSYLAWRPNSGRSKITKATYYTLTSKAKQIFQEQYFIEVLERNAVSNLQPYINSYLEKLEVHFKRYENVERYSQDYSQIVRETLNEVYS